MKCIAFCRMFEDAAIERDGEIYQITVQPAKCTNIAKTFGEIDNTTYIDRRKKITYL